MFTGGRSDAAQEFTNSQARLLAAIDKFMGRKIRSATLERLETEQHTRDTRQPGDRIPDILDPERELNARNTLDSIRSLSNYLGGISGRRKAIVFFSEGIDYDIDDVFNNRGATTIMSATQDAIAAATRANVAIYGIDARGLGAGTDDLIEVQDLPTDPSLNLGTTAFYNEVRLGQDSLRVLLDETGGFALVNTNDFNGGFERLVADNSAYYLLGYYSTNERRDGRYRKIEVKVRQPDLTVRARKGYVAARGRAETDKNDGKTPPELRDGAAQPAADVGVAPGARRRGVQGRGQQGRGRDLDARRRARPAAHRERRQLHESPRRRRHRHRLRAASPTRGSVHAHPRTQARFGAAAARRRLPGAEPD